MCRKFCTTPLLSLLEVQYTLHMECGRRSVVPRFTPGELKVMRLLWEHGELKPAELQERFPEPIKNPALRSYLTTLVEKGHITRRRVGKAYHYKAVTRSRSAFRTMLAELIDTYCGGSVASLVMNLITSEKLSEAELLELKRLADEAEAETPRTTAGERGKGGRR
jgi:predicted transcriptional regulator